MKTLEKYSLNTIINTLKACSGIKIAIIASNQLLLRSIYGECGYEMPEARQAKSSNELILPNGSRLSLLNYGGVLWESQLIGKRFNQIFLSEGLESLVEDAEIRRIITNEGPEGPLFKTGIFQLWDELDFVKRISENLILDIKFCSTKQELQNVLEKAKNQIKYENNN